MLGWEHKREDKGFEFMIMRCMFKASCTKYSSHIFLLCSRRAQAMFMGTKSSTTKEGATIFEVCLPPPIL